MMKHVHVTIMTAVMVVDFTLRSFYLPFMNTGKVANVVRVFSDLACFWPPHIPQHS